jgi:hypothetical protein
MGAGHEAERLDEPGRDAALRQVRVRGQGSRMKPIRS